MIDAREQKQSVLLIMHNCTIEKLILLDTVMRKGVAYLPNFPTLKKWF